MQQCFTPTEKKRNKSRTSLGRQSPVASRPLSEASAAELALAYPACTAAEGPCPLPTGGDSSGVGQVAYATHTQAEQRNTHYVRLEQGKIFPHKAISLTQAVWAL